jgi:osmotically-inducible protein OsmY
MRILRAVLIATLSLTGVWSQTRTAAPSRPAAPAHKRAGTPAPKLSDAELEKTIRARMARSKINSNHFTVKVQGGVATLEGKTDVIQHKGTATRLARTSGAVTVVNHIQISEAARQKAEANLAKGRRRVQVKRSDVRSQTR